MNEIFANLGETLTTLLLPIILVTALIGLIVFIAKWIIYKKAGQPGWATLIPFYSTYAHIKVANLPVWTIVLTITPFIVILKVILWYETARAFGKSKGYGVAINIFNVILIPILGFGKSQYNSQNNEGIYQNTSNTDVEGVNSYESIKELDNNFTETQPITQINTDESMDIIPEQLINIDSTQENIEISPVGTQFPTIEEINTNNSLKEVSTIDEKNNIDNLFDMNFESIDSLDNTNNSFENITTNNQSQEVFNSFELPKNESVDDLLNTIGNADINNEENNKDNELDIDSLTPDVIIPTSDIVLEENDDTSSDEGNSSNVIEPINETIEELNNNSSIEDATNINENTNRSTESIDDLLNIIGNINNENNEENNIENLSEFDINDLNNNNEFDYNSANDQINNLNIPINEEINNQQSESIEPINEIIEDINPNVIIPTSDIVLEENSINEVNSDFNIPFSSDIIEENDDTSSDEGNSSNVIEPINETIEDVNPEIVIPTLEETIELPIIGENAFENTINIEELKENTSDINKPEEKFSIDDLLTVSNTENVISNDFNQTNNNTTKTINTTEVEDGFKTCDNCGTKNIIDAPLCFLCGKTFE